MSLATSSFLRTIIKAVENHLNQRLPRYRRGTVVGQASDPNKILVAPSGENGVADGYEYPIVRPYTSATVGDPGGPALEDDILILETTPNNPAIQGQLLTNPNDKPNRDGYPGIDKVSITQNDAKKLRAHAIVVDHVPPIDADVPATARDGMSIVSTYDNSLWIRSSDVWERESLPVGGTTGQALAKVSNTDYDVSWQTVSGGGAIGQVCKLSRGGLNWGVEDETEIAVFWLLPAPIANPPSMFTDGDGTQVVIQVDGSYLIEGYADFHPDTSLTVARVAIYLNGREVFHWDDGPSTSDRATLVVGGSVPFPLVAGDLVQMYVSGKKTGASIGDAIGTVGGWVNPLDETEPANDCLYLSVQGIG